MIKSTRNGYCDHVQDIRNLSARVENSGEFGMGVWLQFGRREVGWERRRRRNKGRECRQMGVYNGFFRRHHRRNTSVGDSVSDAVDESATSLYGYLSLNPSVMPVGKIAWRHHAVAYFQTNCILRRQNRRYILPTEIADGFSWNQHLVHYECMRAGLLSFCCRCGILPRKRTDYRHSR